MITRITGILNRVLDEEVRLQVGPLEYQVLVPEVVRRQVQTLIGQELSLHTTQFLEGNQASTRFVPRLIGFLRVNELEFFELFCTVDKFGPKKALKAMAQPVEQIASAIMKKDANWLKTLPGVGKTTGDALVVALNGKVTRFAVSESTASPSGSGGPINGRLLEDVYNALLAVGHNPVDARSMLDRLIASGLSFETVEEALIKVYQTR